MVAPFVPNVIDVKNQALTGSLEAMRRSIPQLEDRENLIYFMGRCSHRYKDPARALRLHVVETLAHAGPDVKVSSLTNFSSHSYPFSHSLFTFGTTHYLRELLLLSHAKEGPSPSSRNDWSVRDRNSQCVKLVEISMHNFD